MPEGDRVGGEGAVALDRAGHAAAAESAPGGGRRRRHPGSRRRRTATTRRPARRHRCPRTGAATGSSGPSAPSGSSGSAPGNARTWPVTTTVRRTPSIVSGVSSPTALGRRLEEGLAGDDGDRLVGDVLDRGRGKGHDAPPVRTGRPRAGRAVPLRRPRRQLAAAQGGVHGAGGAGRRTPTVRPPARAPGRAEPAARRRPGRRDDSRVDRERSRRASGSPRAGRRRAPRRADRAGRRTGPARPPGRPGARPAGGCRSSTALGRDREPVGHAPSVPDDDGRAEAAPRLGSRRARRHEFDRCPWPRSVSWRSSSRMSRSTSSRSWVGSAGRRTASTSGRAAVERRHELGQRLGREVAAQGGHRPGDCRDRGPRSVRRRRSAERGPVSRSIGSRSVTPGSAA